MSNTTVDFLYNRKYINQKKVNDDIYGKGVAYPFHFKDGKVATSSGSQKVSDGLKFIFDTRKGERVMRHEFGIILDLFLFKNIRTIGTGGQLQLYLSEAFYQEPRVRFNSKLMQISEGEDSTVRVAVQAKLVGTSNENKIISFDHPIQET